MEVSGTQMILGA